MDGPTVAWMREQASRSTPPSPAACNCAPKPACSTGCCSHARRQPRALRQAPPVLVRGKRTLRRRPRPVSVEWRGWRIPCWVCYDLRFPVFRATASTSNARACSTMTWRCTSPTGRRRAAIRGRRCCARAHREPVLRGRRQSRRHRRQRPALQRRQRRHRFLGHPLSEAADEVVSTMLLQAALLIGHRAKFPALLDGDRFSLDNRGTALGSSEISCASGYSRNGARKHESNQPCLSCSG